jgi:hypothetical protein
VALSLRVPGIKKGKKNIAKKVMLSFVDVIIIIEVFKMRWIIDV